MPPELIRHQEQASKPTEAAPSPPPVRGIAWRVLAELSRLHDAVCPAKCTSAQRATLLALAEQAPLTVAQIAQRLDLSRSTISRAVTPLVERNWIAETPDLDDSRCKELRLKPAGRLQVDRLHEAAERELCAALDSLAADARDQALSSLNLVARALERHRLLGSVVLRRIHPQDDRQLAVVLRGVMEEYGVTGAGTAHVDPEFDALSEAYRQDRCAYFVVESHGRLLGGGGIAPLDGGDADVCELRKMYLVAEARGLGLGNRLLHKCLEAARQFGYRRCYLETMDSLVQARRLYEQQGFTALAAAMGHTGHCRCGQWYLREL